MVADPIIAKRDPVAHLAEAARRSGAAADARVEGTVLVADVSGFTALTASLAARHGARSADLLAVIMDQLIGALGEIAESHGGRVVDVIGDAIHVLWIADEGEASGDTERPAADAALAMLAHAASAGDGEHETPIRVGIASGAIRLAMVGGHADRWNLLALGPTLLSATTACAKAPRSSCLIVTKTPIGGMPGRVEKAKGGWVLQHEGERSGPPLREAVEALAWDAELRLVTVMFCRLVPAADMAKTEISIVHRLTLAVQDIVAEAGGMIDKVHADDKGISVVAAPSGWPRCWT